jgi:hypothetical protein
LAGYAKDLLPVAINDGNDARPEWLRDDASDVVRHDSGGNDICSVVRAQIELQRGDEDIRTVGARNDTWWLTREREPNKRR